MASDMALDYRIRPISAAEYHRMGELGIIGENERVELLDGELIAMPPIGPGHSFSGREITERFVVHFAGRAIVDASGSFALDDFSEPQPDLAVFALCADRYRERLPQAADVLLIVEIAQTSLAYDRGRKLRAYARRNIPEYWIVDLVHAVIVRFRKPEGERYSDERTFGRGEFLSPEAFPDDAIAVDEILP